MTDSEIVPVNDLVEISKAELETHPAFTALSEMSEEQVWLANFKSANTRDAYARAVVSFMAATRITATEELRSVKQAHVLAWRASMERSGLSNETIATRLAALSSLCGHLTDKQLMEVNPVTGVRRPKRGNSGTGSGKSPTLSQRQVRAMLDAPDTEKLIGLRDRAILHVFFFVGARCSEPTLLRVKDFTYDAEYPILTMTMKGSKSHSVAINAECAAAIRAYLDLASHRTDPDAYLFQATINGKPGQPLTRNRLYKIFDRYARLAGINTAAFPHMARATFITRADEANVPTKDIQQTVGHSSVTTTEGYIHRAQKHRDSASLKVGY
ncbi:MAG: tyrosine-type recombinase/integrase [Pseudomonadota bacterium]